MVSLYNKFGVILFDIAICAKYIIHFNEGDNKMHLKIKIIKSTAAVLSAAFVCLCSAAGYYSSKLPAVITKEPLTDLRIAEYPEISCSADPVSVIRTASVFPQSDQVTLSIFGAIPVKSVQVREAEAPVLVAGGNPFGIKLLMDGVMVTQLGAVLDNSGRTVCPAENAGIQVGDIIRSVDGESIVSNSRLQEIVSESGGKSMKITAERDGREFTVTLDPVYSKKTNMWRGGMWVRDSVAGIGTITFISKKTGEFAGLGHPICDADTGELVPLYSGEAVPVEIIEAKKGEKGIPGELHGCFAKGAAYGTLNRNNGCGIYGNLTDEAVEELCGNAEEFIMGYRQEITTGKAEIYTTISGCKPEKYSIEIESIDFNGSDDSRNMVIRITDKRLIEAAGGIIQGMSGSPIIQNGKLIGAVTHVFVADPTRGYAIFAENMAEYLEG